MADLRDLKAADVTEIRRRLLRHFHGRNAFEIDDGIQMALYYLLRSCAGEPNDVRGLLYVSAMHKTLTLLRGRRRRERVKEKIAPQIDVLVTSTRAPEDELIEAERQAEIVRAIKSLPRKQRCTLKLRYFQGKSRAETARIMGLSKHTVKEYRKRTLLRLREQLA